MMQILARHKPPSRHTIKFMAVARMLLFSSLCLFFRAADLAEAQVSRYEEYFTKGLQEEAAKNWSAAIQYYTQAREDDPTKSFPLKRIEAIFQDRLKAGEPIDVLRSLLPPDLENDLERRGIFRLEGFEEAEPLSWLWDILIYGVVILGISFVAYFLFKRVRRQDEKDALDHFYANTKKTRVIPSNTGEQARPKELQMTKAKPSTAVVTERTREDMDDMISSVHSLTQEIRRPDFAAMSQEEEDELKDTDIVKALAATLISDVEIKEKDGAKFSKLSMDASLVFDANDVEFFEKEFSASAQDIEDAKRKGVPK